MPLENNLLEILEESKKKIDENKKFLKQFKHRKIKNLDYIFHEAHEEIFEDIDCLTCANCCKTTSPIFRDKDIQRLAKYFKVKVVKFIDDYLHVDSDGDYVLNEAPCPFLAGDNYCMVYDARPNACREYPHTNRKNMHQLIDLTLNNTLVCPAVAKIVDKIKASHKPKPKPKKY